MTRALSITEVQKTIGVGRTKIYELINSGKLKARKLDKRTFILEDDLHEFLTSLTVISEKTFDRGD